MLESLTEDDAVPAVLAEDDAAPAVLAEDDAALAGPRPGRPCPRLTEGLWDCEADVRLLAAEHAPRDEMVDGRLAHLRDDPMESAEVRAATRARLS